MASDAIDCGTHSCNAGSKCGSGNKCLAQNAVDCGGGRSCPVGHLCVRGGAECLTRQEIADRAAAVKAAELKRIEEQQEAARLKEERRKQEIARRKEEADRILAAKKQKEEDERASRQQAAEERAAAIKAANEKAAEEKAAAAKVAAAKAAADKAAAEAKRKAEAEAKQKAEEAKRLAADEAKRKADQLAAEIKARKAAEGLTETLVKSNVAAATSLKTNLLVDLPSEAVTHSVSAVADTTLKGALSIAMPQTLSAAQRRAAAKELADLWTTNLTRANFGPIAGGFAKGVVVGAAIDYAGNKTGDFLAAVVAKHTSNNFAIEFARSGTQVAFADAYAWKGGVPGVLATNGIMIAQASAGLVVDTKKAATSIRAYEVQINDVIARAHQERDPEKRDRLLKTAMKALESLKGLKESHPVITTLSNITIEDTLETLKTWVP